MNKRRRQKFYSVIIGISLLLLAGILFWAWLSSSPLRSRLTLEAGDHALTDTDFLRIKNPGLNCRMLTDIAAIDTHVPGDYAIQFLVNGETQVSILRIRDTKPPTAEIQDVVLPVGSSCPPEAFFARLEDETKVVTTINGLPAKPENLSPGNYDLKLLLTDAGGNEATYSATLKIKNVRAVCQAELGTESFPASRYLLSDTGTNRAISYTKDITLLLSQAGTYSISLSMDGDVVPVELVVADTLPPKIKSKKAALWLGEEAKPEDFVKKLSDASDVTVSYRKKPDFSKTGVTKVSLLAEDFYGNKTKFTAKMTISRDTAAPSILGVRDLSFPQGVTITYRKSVFAMDNKDGAVSFQVDSSQNPGKQGTYPVTYLAEDSSGNQSSVTAKITITEPLAITEEDVWALADEILLELGIAPVGSDVGREYRELRAIFDWCASNIHYTGISDKSSELKAAHDGLTTRTGDCYTYFSVADMLLTRAGYESMEIDRSGTNTFHSWNLVKYQDSWYHFDACPLLAGETFVPFLVSDQDLTAFSKDYGKRHPDESHQNYYQFSPDSYPERGKVSIADESK